MKRIVALISGRGSNLRAIAEACERERWPAVLAAVISDRADAAGCEWARARGLRVELVERRGFSDRDSFDRALADCIAACEPDVIVLAGFMRILDPALVARFAGRILNIHPSLLPAFPGLHTHRRALEAGVRLHGATVHYVIAELDAGPIIAQAALSVADDEDESALAARVLAIEHRLYPLALRWHLEGRLRLDGQRVRLERAMAEEQQSWLQ